MKAYQVLLSILGVFALMGIGWAVFPAQGVELGGLTLHFASLKGSIAEASETKVDVDKVLSGVDQGLTLESGSSKDTLDYYRNYFYSNEDRVFVPGDDYKWFDGVFASFEGARRQGKVLRVKHYGDSQIEMDRISSGLREGLQKRFGGSGTGMFPALSNVPSASVYRSASGGMAHYTMYGDSTTRRAPHRRYGVMAQLTSLYGGGTESIRVSSSSTVKPLCKSFSRVSLLMGRNSDGFSARVVSDTMKLGPETVARDTTGAVLVSFKFPRAVTKASLIMKGNAEIYGIMADGDGGVAVDNIPLRGCSGTIFTRIDKAVMTRSFQLDGTRLIILQFGGNYMPSIHSDAAIGEYTAKIAAQIRYFQEVAPSAKILFIGPSDMGKSVGGRIVTWPRLPKLVDALKATCLENGAAFWDLYHMMGGENSMGRWVKHSPAYAGPDYIHFTSKGAEVVGDALTRSLLVYHDFYRLRKSLGNSAVDSYMKR